MRRTVDSVNARWGNLTAILAGDFLLARASELAASLGVEVAGLLACDDRAAVRGPDPGAEVRVRRRPLRGAVPDRDRRQDRGAARDLVPHRRHRRRPPPRTHRRPRDLRPQLRHGVPARRRRAGPGVRRVRAGQARGTRHRGGRLHPAGDPGVRGAHRRRAPQPPRQRHRSRGSWTAPSTSSATATASPGRSPRARAYAELGREALSVLPDSSGVLGLFAAADYLLDSVEAAAA